MDKDLKSFVSVSLILVLFLFSFLSVLGYLYRYSTINTYNILLLFLIALTIIILSAVIFSVFALFYAYREKRVAPAFRGPVKFGLRILLPLMLFSSGLTKGSKDSVKKFYIDINNILVESGGYRYRAEDILILLPHCLQNSGCGYKITGDIFNCRRCGKCCIKEIAELSRDTGVKVAVVTGGTAARNIVRSSRPGMVLSVACERDLASGISDIRGIPVVGLLNERPNGPCVDTRVDIEALRQKLQSVLKN